MADNPTVNTMRGPRPTAELGFTLMHEHVFVHSAGVLDNWPHLWDRDAEIQKAITALNEAKANGVDTILDLTTIDLGRDIARLKEVADHVDLNMIVATGLWLDAPRSITRLSPEGMADLFIHDIEEGIGDTGVKAGAIKVASEPVVDGPNAQILKAAAMAHRKTGVPISTHTFVRNASGLAQQNVFERAGVDLSRVVIGHTGDSEDLEYIEAVVKRGSYIGMDRFGPWALDGAARGGGGEAVRARPCRPYGPFPRLELLHGVGRAGPRPSVAGQLRPRAPRGDSAPARPRRNGGAGRGDDGGEPAAHLRGAGRILAPSNGPEGGRDAQRAAPVASAADA